MNAGEIELSPLVSTGQGELQGVVKTSSSRRKFFAFLGVPYAKPPVGKLRFKPPQPAEKWSGVLKAIKDGPASMQVSPLDGRVVGQEDCLVLNIFTHQLSDDDSKHVIPNRSVMVWIHGGSFQSGSCSSKLYGPELLMNEDIVLVSINYRLGILGFLSTGDEALPGNNGLKDQAMALQWIHHNISAFGGNPNSVTIFGESAGAASAHLHMFSPLSRGFFHRVIAQSGTAFSSWTFDRNGLAKARQLGELMGIEKSCSTAVLIDRLCEKDATEITKQLPKFMRSKNSLVFSPVLETAGCTSPFLLRNPLDMIKESDYKHMPLLLGFTKDEGAFIAAPIVESPERLSAMDKDWEGPCSRLIKYDNLNSHQAQAIRNFYFSNQELTRDTAKNFVNMVSDGLFIYPAIRTLQLHATYGKTPVYLYVFSHRPKLSFTDIMMRKRLGIDYGVCHTDELQFLFGNYASYFRMPVVYTEEEKQMSREMVKMWTNFAKTGDPTPTAVDNPLSYKWLPVNNCDELNYIHIRVPIEEGKQQHLPLDRIHFWKELNLPDTNIVPVG